MEEARGEWPVVDPDPVPSPKSQKLNFMSSEILQLY